MAEAALSLKRSLVKFSKIFGMFSEFFSNVYAKNSVVRSSLIICAAYITEVKMKLFVFL